MRRTLDPKLDVVFKLLFADVRNRRVLISLLTAVLRPAAPIVDVTILNPDTPKETAVEKGAVLDVLVQLADGAQIDLEMQARQHPGLRQRGLFYWARIYTSQIGRGDHYLELQPTVCIFILNFSEFDSPRFHSIFKALEVHEHHEFSPHFAHARATQAPGRGHSRPHLPCAKVGSLLQRIHRRRTGATCYG